MARKGGRAHGRRKSAGQALVKAAPSGMASAELSRSGARTTSAPTVSLTDAVQGLTGAAVAQGGTYAPVQDLPRDPLDVGPFGPLWPLHVQAINPPRKDTGRPEPRVWEYPQGFNLPGGGDRLIDWGVLRAASTNVDVIRRCIEIRKDDVRDLPWSWAISEDAIKAAQEADPSAQRDDIEAELRKKYAPDIARLTEMWKRPWVTNGVRWGQWVSAVLEEHIVLDAVAIYPVTTVSGEVIAFRVVDGSTIKLLINDLGERPQPPHPAFQQSIYGFPRGEFIADVVLNEETGEEDVAPGFTASQLTYWRENFRTYTPYGFSAVEQALVSAALYLKRQGWMHANYDSGSTPMTWLVPQGDKFTATQLAPQQRREYEQAINDDLGGQTSARQRIKISYPGFEPVQMKTEAEQYKPDYDLHLVKMVIGHLGVTSDRFGLTEAKGLGATGQHERQAEVQDDSGVNPDVAMLSELVMELSRNYLDAPLDLEFKFLTGKVDDEAAADQVADAQLKRGTITLNDDRRRIGKPVYSFPEADKPAFIGATGPMFWEGAEQRAQAAQEQQQMLADAKANPPAAGGGGASGGGGAGGSRPKPKPSGPAPAPKNKAAASGEIVAYRRWLAKQRDGVPRRPFHFEHAEPHDLAAEGQELHGALQVFDGYEWRQDITKDWRSWNAAHPLHPRGPHGRFVKVGNLVDELREHHGALSELHEDALDEAARRVAAGRHFRRGDSQLADDLERRGLLEEYGGVGGNKNRLEISEAGRQHLARRWDNPPAGGTEPAPPAPEPDVPPTPELDIESPKVDEARARQARIDHARGLAEQFADVEEMIDNRNDPAEIARRIRSAADRNPGNEDMALFASTIEGHQGDTEAMRASARSWAAQHGMSPIGQVGESVEFDPSQHYAPDWMRRDMRAEGVTRMDIVRPGYMLHDEVSGEDIRMHKPAVDFPDQETSPVPAPVEHPPTPEGVIAAIRDINAEPGEWVSMTELRRKLGGSRAEQDRAITDAAIARQIRAHPEENQQTLTAEDRSAAIDIGGEPKHHVQIPRIPARRPVETVTPLSGGDSADVALVTHSDGSQAVRKRITEEADGRSPKDQADAEELGAKVAAALGVRTPGVTRTGENSLELEYLPGQSGKQAFGKTVPADILASDQGRRMGLLDSLTGNTDRHAGNWMVGSDGTLAAIDNGLMFNYEQSAAPGRNPFGQAHFPEGAMLSAEEAAAARASLAALAPEFDRLGHADWHAQMMARLDEMAPAPAVHDVSPAPSMEDARGQGLDDRMRQAEAMYGTDRSKWPAKVQREAARMEIRAARQRSAMTSQAALGVPEPAAVESPSSGGQLGDVPATVGPMTTRYRRIELTERRQGTLDALASALGRGETVEAGRLSHGRGGGTGMHVSALEWLEREKFIERVDTDGQPVRVGGRFILTDKGRGQVSLSAPAQTPASVAAPAPIVAGETLAQTVRSVASREAAQRVIAHLTVPQLRQLAKDMDVPYGSKDTKTRLRDTIVQHAVGARLTADAILADRRGDRPTPEPGSPMARMLERQEQARQSTGSTAVPGTAGRTAPQGDDVLSQMQRATSAPNPTAEPGSPMARMLERSDRRGAYRAGYTDRELDARDAKVMDAHRASAIEGRMQSATNIVGARRELGGLSRGELDSMVEHTRRGQSTPDMRDDEVRESLARAVRGRHPRRLNPGELSEDQQAMVRSYRTRMETLEGYRESLRTTWANNPNMQRLTRDRIRQEEQATRIIARDLEAAGVDATTGQLISAKAPKPAPSAPKRDLAREITDVTPEQRVRELESMDTREEAAAYLAGVKGAELEALARRFSVQNRPTAAAKRKAIIENTVGHRLNGEAIARGTSSYTDDVAATPKPAPTADERQLAIQVASRDALLAERKAPGIDPERKLAIESQLAALDRQIAAARQRSARGRRRSR